MTAHLHALVMNFQERRLPWPVRLYRNWRARTRVAALSIYDEFTLRDIGLTPGDIFRAMEMPLSRNAETALRQRVAERETW